MAYSSRMPLLIASRPGQAHLRRQQRQLCPLQPPRRRQQLLQRQQRRRLHRLQLIHLVRARRLRPSLDHGDHRGLLHLLALHRLRRLPVRRVPPRRPARNTEDTAYPAATVIYANHRIHQQRVAIQKIFLILSKAFSKASEISAAVSSTCAFAYFALAFFNAASAAASF